MDLSPFWHYLQIILLGIIEGITEFLPISSTGHLLIAEAFGLGHQSDVFNVVIQAGAIAAVVLIYWPKLLDIALSLDEKESRLFVAKLVVSTLITLVISLIVVKQGYKLPQTVTPVALATLIGGGFILLIEFMAKAFYPRDQVGWFEACVMGFAQVLAEIFPGASRSGASIMSGLILGVKRTAATEFSFLIGIPTMFAASAYELLKLYKDYKAGESVFNGQSLSQVMLDTTLGFIVSAVVAFFVVKWLLRYIQSHTFNGFGYYRILLGGGLLLAMGLGYLKDVEADAPKKMGDAVKSPVEVVPAPAEVLPETAPVPVMTNPSTETNAVAPVSGETMNSNLSPVSEPETNIAPVPPSASTNDIPVAPVALSATNAAPVVKPKPVSLPKPSNLN